MNAETLRIADQLRRAFIGDAWHGDPLEVLLAGVTAEQAHARPLPMTHNIWELVLHIDAWAQAASEAVQGVPMPKLENMSNNWRSVTDAVTDGSDASWASTKLHLFQTGEQLAQAVETFPDARLTDVVPGRKYDYYHLFHGIVQHSLYHGGQIAMLSKA